MLGKKLILTAHPWPSAAPNGANLALREFSYEIEIGNGETTYSRYNTYANAKEVPTSPMHASVRCIALAYQRRADAVPRRLAEGVPSQD